MNEREITSVDLVEGGNVIKQGHYLTLGFIPRDVDGNAVDLTGKSIAVALYNKKQIIYETTAAFSGGVLRFTINEIIESGNAQVEFTATSSTDAGYRQKFPTNKNDGRLSINRSSDDLDYFGMPVTTVTQFREEFDQAINALPVDSEINLARIGEDGTVYPHLPARLDAEQQETATLLTNTSTKVAAIDNVKLIGSVRYGKFDVDAFTTEIGFPAFNHNMNFMLYRDVDGVVKHTFNFDKRIEGWNVFYVDGVNGVQANSGLTKALPKLNIDVTITEIEANPAITSAVIVLVGNYIPRTRSAIGTGLSITKNYAITAESPRFFAGSIEPNLTWTNVGGGVFSAARSGVTAVFDDTVRSLYDLPTKYKKVSTLAECTSTPGSWFQSGSTINVHRLNNAVPINGETYVCVDALTMQPVLKTDSLFMVRNMTLLSGATTHPAYFSADSGTKGNVILYNVKVHSSGGTTTNGISSDNLNSFWLFNSMALEIQRDGFNYHATNGGHCFVFEYNCFAENCGVNDVTNINNITTAHEAIHILRVGTKGRRSKGPLLADVHGCYSISLDCDLAESLLADDTAYNKAAFFFEDNSTSNGKAVLINCGGGDKRTKGISCGTSFKAEGKIAVMNFVGRNIPSDINFTIL